MLRTVVRVGLFAVLVLATWPDAAIGDSAPARRTGGTGRSGDDARWVAPAAPVSPEARRHWALARMNEATAQIRRCRERFRRPGEVRDCEAQFTRRYRAFNEIYIEASR